MKYYILRITFADKIFTLPMSSGVNPKFTFEENIQMQINYDKMEETFMEIVK
jgi:hypothetical protein